MINKYPQNSQEHDKEKGERGTRKNGSITQFTGVLRDMVESAGNRMEYITLFEEPFPYVQSTEDIMNKVW